MRTGCRDDFPESVKRALALRVNYRCSNPACGASTSGPQVEPARVLNIGVAAHITAASAGGPRYDSNLSEDQRSSATNGIWLCQNCAKLVDNDQNRFTETMLRHWKEAAESNAQERIGRQSPFEKRSAPEIRVVKDETCPMLTHPNRTELPREKLVEELKHLLPADVQMGEIKLLDRGLGSFGQPFAILAVGTDSGWNWKIVFLCAGEFGWEILAQTSLVSQHGWVPTGVYVPGTPGALVLTHVNGYGTGVFRQSSSWYRIAKGEPLPLLSFPVTFHVVGWGMPFDRKLTSRVLSMPARLQSRMILELEFVIEYTIGQSSGDDAAGSSLFSTEQRISLEWAETAGVFVPRTPNDDLATVDELWNESTEGFIKRNLATLQHVASHGTYQQREFIHRHLLAGVL